MTEVERHRAWCANVDGKCRTCKIDESTFDQWDFNHRGSTLKKKYMEKSTREICLDRGWVVNKPPPSSKGMFSSIQIGQIEFIPL